LEEKILKKVLKTIGAFFLAGVFTALMFSCSGQKVEELKKERVFTIPIGVGEEQIGVIREQNGIFSSPDSLIFKNGFFYVVDSVNQKILKITKPGDVILVLSRGVNDIDSEDNVLRTKERKHFQFNNIGKIAVDGENNIYVEDRFTQKLPEKTEIDIFETSSNMDTENNEIVVSQILKFDRLGNFLYRIGKYGVNTEPFYYVYKIDVDDSGNLIVLTTDEEWRKWTYQKFDTEGRLIFSDSISSDILFDENNLKDSAYFILDVFPVSSSAHLLFWISQYDTSHDTESFNEEEEIWGEEIEIENFEKQGIEGKSDQQEYARDLLYYKLLYYNLENSEIDRSYEWEARMGTQQGVTEEFLGIDDGVNGFLWRYVDSTKAIISILRPNGTLLARRSFIFEDDGIWTNVTVAVDGSISALKIDDKLLHFYRWRSDKLLTNQEETVTIKQFIKDKIREFKNANR
jgi:hypothetical protein